MLWGEWSHHQLRGHRPQLHGNAPTNAPAGIRGGAGALRPDQQHQRQMLMVRTCHGIAIVPDIVPEAREGSLVRIKMNMGEMIRYDMVRLASNSSPAAQALMEFT